MSNEPDLLFGPDVATSGFTPAGIAAFSDLRPAAVVRELIQNSLDAALVEAGEECARVRFRRTRVGAGEIPGLANYKAAFKLAVETQKEAGGGRMPTQAESVVGRIEDALEDPYPEVLCVTDNGIGLDDRRMSALLSDGVSSKTASSAGTFGNGHSVAVPASDLRYVLYGGVVAEGRKIGAGQAIVASHNVPGDKHPRSSRGFYIKDFRIGADGSTHEYASGSSVPPLVDREIEWIRENHGHGAVVIIPHFNNFQDDRSLQKMVARAAACNFFQAIHEGRLVVEVEDEMIAPDDDETEGTGSWTLDRETLPQVLEEYREEKRIRNGAFLTGEKANEVHETLLKGELFSVPTTRGEVSLRLQQGVGNNQVCLIRNGMWITDSLPELRKASFTDRQPFQAVLLLEADNRSELYKLIQQSETPLHNNLAIKQLSPEDRKKLKAALKEVREWILSLVPEMESDSFSISGLLDVQFEGVQQGLSGGKHRRSFWGTPVARRRGMPSPDGDDGDFGEGTNGGGGGGSGDRTRKSNPPTVHPSLFQVASAPAGPGRQRVHIVPKSDCKKARLRMFVDENIDVTCDRQKRSEAILARLSNVSINGEPASAGPAQGYSIDLGKISENKELEVEADYEVPKEILMLPGQNPTLRVEVVRVRDRTSTSAKKPPSNGGNDG